jgi:acyl-CoA synthetase (AMP-forming)/AMP-acid ligase II
MSLTFYLDKGASLDPGAPCLTLDEKSRSYAEVVDLSHAVARALRRSGVAPGDKVGVLSANDPTAFSCVLGIARAGAVWCPINPRNAAGGDHGTAGPVRLRRAAVPPADLMATAPKFTPGPVTVAG